MTISDSRTASISRGRVLEALQTQEPRNTGRASRVERANLFRESSRAIAKNGGQIRLRNPTVTKSRTCELAAAVTSHADQRAKGEVRRHRRRLGCGRLGAVAKVGTISRSRSARLDLGSASACGRGGRARSQENPRDGSTPGYVRVSQGAANHADDIDYWARRRAR